MNKIDRLNLVTPMEPGLIRLLDRLAIILVGLSVALRPLANGAASIEPETAFCQVLILFALCIRLTRWMMAGQVWVPSRKILIAAGAFTACMLLSLWKAGADGSWQPAADMAANYGVDLLGFFLIADLARHTPTRRMLLSMLGGSLALLCVYGLYQRGYGLDYFRSVMQGEPDLISATVGSGKLQNQMFNARIGSDRIPGPYGYPNAMAAVLLLFAPVAMLLAARSVYRRLSAALLFATIMTAAFTGSKAGTAAAFLLHIAVLVFLNRGGSASMPPASSSSASWKTHLIKAWDAALFLAGLGVFAGFGAGIALMASKNMTLALIAGSILWAAGLLPRLRRPVFAYTKRVRLMGGAVAFCLCALVGAVLVLPKEKLPAKIQTVRTELDKHLGVRLGYWDAAARMGAANPLAGVGLDNFGQRYGQYRAIWAWSVKRAHNTLLQMFADGGVPLVLSLLVLWAVAFSFFRKRKAAGAAGDDSGWMQELGLMLHPVSMKTGLYLGVAAMAVTGVFFLRGIFAGLSLEYILHELYGNPSTSAWANGNPLALVIHSGVHLLLPAAWCCGFVLVWTFTQTAERFGDLTKLVSVGAAAFLLHSLFDFDYTNASLYALFWTVMALGISPNLPWKPCNSRVVAGVGVALGLVAVFFLGSARMNAAIAVHIAENEVQMAMDEKPFTPERYEQVLNSVDSALALRPEDSSLWRLRAQTHTAYLSVLRGNWMNPREAEKLYKQWMADWQKSIALQPWFADGYAVMARVILQSDRSAPALETAADYVQKAIARSPQKPLYRLELGLIRKQQGLGAEAKALADEALSLHQKTTDERMQLTKEELRQANTLLQYK